MSKRKPKRSKTLTNADGSEIRLRKNSNIGALDAETDSEFLQGCFLSNSDFQSLESCNDPNSIVLGRTGSGKSAFLIHTEEIQENVVRLDPVSLSIHYIENSSIIAFFEELNVNLDLFYRLLWRHVLVVELLKKRYGISSESQQKSVIGSLVSLVKRDKAKRRALDYLSEWGDRFWLETDARVREITEKFEGQLGASIGGDVGLGKASIGSRLSNEERVEIVERAKRVVSSIQLKELTSLLDVLADNVFDDEMKKHFIVIDHLDENWASIEVRCRLIRALIEEIKKFRKLSNVKIAVAMREDLLSQVFDRTRGAGFQEEKYEAYILRLKWTPFELSEIVESRIAKLFERQYTKKEVGIHDLFPRPRKGGQTAMDFMLERTLLRPRDIIQFVNECLRFAVESPRISWRAVRAAESTYSEKRLKSLHEEWAENFPALHVTLGLLDGVPSEFSRGYVSGEKLDDVVKKLVVHESADICAETAKAYFSGSKKSCTEGEMRTVLIRCLYQVGAIGIRLRENENFVWSYIDQPVVSEGDVKRCLAIKVHKMLWRALGVIEPVNEKIS